ncbi:unnamed protein product [Adineta ricciae]|uniref:CUE domain-containing protein n=1 Tax=Adineta ricciae TaxID=249248 RepID=A0A813VF68_ADIRI|nr:unnamed protein product [Adineta ricciae]
MKQDNHQVSSYILLRLNWYDRNEMNILKMIELPDLFNENRVQEISLSFILYAPIGICLVVLRSIALLFLVLISFIIPASSSLEQLIIEAISLILTFTFDNESSTDGKDNRHTAKIIVTNRVSLFDGVALRRFFYNTNCKVVHLWKNDSWTNWFRLNAIDYLQNQEELLSSCVKDLECSGSKLIFLPECEPTTGTDGLLIFNPLPFTLANKVQLPVLPICLRTSRTFHIRTTTFNSHPLSDLFWFLFSPYTKYHLKFLPSISPEASSSNENFCERVRETMARNMGIQLTQFDERDVIDLKKRPDLFQRRHAQRRDEFQQMINLVHQKVPIASLEAIRYDLEMTKNVQTTIDNLNERATAVARAANQSSTTSSHAMSTSSKNSSTSNHRQTYERLKQELIEKNRQLFLNKNCN